MQFSDEENETSNYFKTSISSAVINQIYRESVKITNDQKGDFTGSGVLIKYNGSPAILTAAHNILIAQDLKESPGDDIDKSYEIVKRFITDGKTSITYDTKGEALTEEVIVTGAVMDSSFFKKDLIILQIKAAAAPLNNYLINNIMMDMTPNYVYSKELAHQILNPKPDTLIRVGFGTLLNENGDLRQGNITDNAHMLITRIKKGCITLAYDSYNVQLGSSRLYEAKDTNSTSKGDSGGPVYTLDEKGNKFLCGVNMGANYFNKFGVSDPTKVENNAFSSLYQLNFTILV